MTVSTGIISTIAGGGSAWPFGGDNGQATSASLYCPRGAALDSSGITHSNFYSYFNIVADFITNYLLFNKGNVYIADQCNNRIRKVTVSTGIMTTVAGSSTSCGYSGDNGKATSATFCNQRAVTLDSAGSTTYLLTCLFAFVVLSLYIVF